MQHKEEGLCKKIKNKNILSLFNKRWFQKTFNEPWLTSAHSGVLADAALLGPLWPLAYGGGCCCRPALRLTSPSQSTLCYTVCCPPVWPLERAWCSWAATSCKRAERKQVIPQFWHQGAQCAFQREPALCDMWSYFYGSSADQEWTVLLCSQTCLGRYSSPQPGVKIDSRWSGGLTETCDSWPPIRKTRAHKVRGASREGSPSLQPDHMMLLM